MGENHKIWPFSHSSISYKKNITFNDVMVLYRTLFFHILYPFSVMGNTKPLGWNITLIKPLSASKNFFFVAMLSSSSRLRFYTTWGRDRSFHLPVSEERPRTSCPSRETAFETGILCYFWVPEDYPPRSKPASGGRSAVGSVANPSSPNTNQ